MSSTAVGWHTSRSAGATVPLTLSSGVEHRVEGRLERLGLPLELGHQQAALQGSERRER
jgi:hypothetical protein